MLEFHLACVPPTVTFQAKRIVRVGGYPRIADAPQLTAARALLETLLLPHQPPEPLTGPVSLWLEFTWPWLASTPKRIRLHHARIRKLTKPDCSNLAKTLEDRLAALRFIDDDALVVRLHVEKWLGDVPGIHVMLAPLPEVETPVAARALRLPADRAHRAELGVLEC